MATASLPPLIKFQPLLADQTLPGGRLYSYIAGTSTPLATLTADGLTPNPNPLILDGNGCADFRLGGEQAYKLDLFAADGTHVSGWPVDNVSNPSLDLASTVDATRGAGMVGYNAALNYAAATVGGAIQAITVGLGDKTAASTGAGMIGYGATIGYPADTIGGAVRKLEAQGLATQTTAGVAPAYTLTPNLALLALATGSRYRVLFHDLRSAEAAPTLAVSGLEAKAIKQISPSGQKSAPLIVVGVVYDIQFDGTDWVILNPLPQPQGNHKGIKITTTGNSHAVTIAAELLIVRDFAGSARLLAGVGATANLGLRGENGLDDGTVAANTWYSVWVIHNSSSSVTSGLLSALAENPECPDGFDFKRRIGWVRTDGTPNAHALGGTQNGDSFSYRARTGTNLTGVPYIASGATANAAWETRPTADFIPSTACAVRVGIYTNNQGDNAFSAGVAAYQPVALTDAPAFYNGNQYQSNICSDTAIYLDSRDIYYSSNQGNGRVRCYGWIDSI